MAKVTANFLNSDTLRSRRGRIGNYLEEFLEVGIGSLDVTRHFDDFLGDEIQGSGGTPGMYQIATGVDGALNIEDATVTNGEAMLRASNGNGSDNEYGGLSMGLNWRGEQNAVFVTRLKIDTLATVKVEIGFTDAVDDAGAVNVLATPSFTAADSTGWILDTDDTAYWQYFGVDSGTGITKVENANAPVADTYETFVVALRDTNSRGLRLDANGHVVEDTGWQSAAVTAGVDLTPWIFVQLRTGTLDRNVTIDYWGAWQRRSASN